MIFRQYYLACLSHASYLVGDESSGRAVVVDPQRDVSAYLDDARRHGLRIEKVIETHFHADFLSGHLELSAETDASICYGEPAEADFPIEVLRDGDRIDLGLVELEVMATPGHTPESISVVVRDASDGPHAPPYGVLTGDTLFIGDVGRPDLLSSEGMTAHELARHLYRSLREKLLTLPDETRVFPAHGAGSACGKNLSTETSSTIGDQRRTNYALQPMTEDEFVHVVTDGQAATPLYFPFSAHRNRERHSLLDEHTPPPPLSATETLDKQSGGAVVLDTRDANDFAAGHLMGAVNVGLGGRFAEYSGDVLRPDQEVVLVCEDGREMEAKVRLARIGFDRVVGYLANPVQVLLDNPHLVGRASRMTAEELDHHRAETPRLQLVDVRNPGEVAGGAIPRSIHMPLARILSRSAELDPRRPVVVYCAGGYRSSIGASLLRSLGFGDVSDLLGGYQAWDREAALSH